MDPITVDKSILWRGQLGTDWVVQEEGCANKRRLSAQVAEPQQISHAHPNFLQTRRSVVSFKLENGVKIRSNQLTRYSYSQSVLNIRQPTSKDVDFSNSKMQEIYHPARKRQYHHHSSDQSLYIAVRGSPQPKSDEEVILPALPFNGENEGVATSCKRIKTSIPESSEQQHSNGSKLSSQSRPGLEGATEGALKQIRSVERAPNKWDYEVEISDQDEAVLRKRAAAKDNLSGSDDSVAEYNSSPRNISDSWPLVRLNSATAAPKMQKKVVGVKKKDMNPGAFRPHNRFKVDLNRSSSRQPPRFFNFDDHSVQIHMDRQPAIKRQKLGNQPPLKRDFPNSVAEESHRTPTKSQSPLNSKPIKAEQSVNSDTHLQRPDLNYLGVVDEYSKLEALVSKPPGSIRARPQRKYSYVGINTKPLCSPRLAQRRALPQSPTNLTQSIKTANFPTSIELDDIREVSLGQKKYQTPVNDSKIANVSEGAITNVEDSKEVNESELKSHYFKDPQRRNETVGIELRDDTTSLEHALTAPASVSEKSRDDSRTPSSLAEDDHSPDDNIDLLDPDANLRCERQVVEVQIISRKELPNPFARHLAGMISTESNIPDSLIQARPRMQKIQQMSNAHISLDFVFLKSGAAEISITKDCEPWQLQYNFETKAFDIIANGEPFSGKDLLIVKPEKIIKAIYHEQCGKVLLARRGDSGFHLGEMQILVEMRNPLDAYELTQFLQTQNHSIKIFTVKNPEKMDQYFAATESHFTKAIQHAERKPLHRPESKPLDVVLLERKESRSAVNGYRAPKAHPDPIISLVNESRPANVRHSSTTVGAIATAGQHRRNTVVGKMTKSAVEEASLQSRPLRALAAKDATSIPPTLLPAAAVNEKSLGDRRLSTRGSNTREQNGELVLQPTKQRPPSPIRWTEHHPNWMEDKVWKNPLVFPAEGRKQQAMVVAEDIVRLDAGNFLNDNLIALYLRYLEDRLEMSNPELAKRIYFQNTFFYASLTKGKVRSNNINYEAVKRWSTKAKVDIFSYDYIVVPVNENLHWYVAIIYNAPKLLQAEEGNDPPSQALAEQAKPEDINAEVHEQIYKDVSIISKFPNNATSEKVATHTADSTSASPSVTVQVEQMSLDDATEDWPEPDAMPEHNRSEMAQLKRPDGFTPPNEDLQNAAVETEDSTSQKLSRKKRLKRKSTPTSRKNSRSDPRIITLDSLGGSHSPTCSNLLEYLVCEGRERHGVDIQARRLGMTAKGLPQQSNYCDCGVYVLGYMERFLKDPDRFVGKILCGDMAVDEGWEDMDAPKMRESIRELIFQLQRKQARREHKQRALRATSKRIARIETEALESSKPPSNVAQSVSTASSKAATPIDLSVDSNSPASTRQPIVVVTDDNEMDRARPGPSNNTKLSPVEIEDEDVVTIQETKPNLEDILASKGIKPEAANLDGGQVEPTTWRSQDRKTEKPASRIFTFSGDKVDTGSASPTSSPSRSKAKSEEPSVSSSLFRSGLKGFRKPSIEVPYQRTHSQFQRGSNEDHPLAINEMGSFEIPESPTEHASPEI